MQLAALLALKLAREEGKFVVVDADGLWMIANAEGGVKSVQGYERCVLTPNKVEMGRLCEAVVSCRPSPFRLSFLADSLRDALFLTFFFWSSSPIFLPLKLSCTPSSPKFLDLGR